MARYCSHTIILPDESILDNFVVEVNGFVEAYYPFSGEQHSTIYIDSPLFLSYRSDLEGKTIALDQLTWAFRNDESDDSMIFAYRLTPCPSCVGDRFVLSRLE